MFIKVSITRCSCLVIFYFKSSVFRHASESHLWNVYKAFRNNYISGSVWHKSFIQMVKYSFPDKRIVYRGAPLTFSYFYLSSRKVVCFGTRFKVACLDRVSLWRKNLVVVFAPWRWDCWSVCPRFYLTKISNFWFNGKIILIFSQ